jgi:DNA invertase Pin-like site-specific DNA recombinase
MSNPDHLVCNAIAYYRISTGTQGKSVLGLDAQQAAVRRFAAAEGIELIGELTEVETGKGTDVLDRRPVLRDALAQARRAKATVVVAKLDRLARDVHFVSGLMAHGVPFITVEHGVDADPFMLHIYAAFAEKTREALARQKIELAEGRKLGNPRNLAKMQRMGQAANRKAADAFAANVLPVVHQIQAAGATGLAAIAKALNDRGIRTAHGGAWHETTVRNLLARATRGAPGHPSPVQESRGPGSNNATIRGFR